MHYVGVDLAWGERRPTGLAVLDDRGRLLHVGSALTDDEIAAALAPYVEGDCVVAIDAPLVVTNPTGSRPAEQALSADFRAFEAGTHPSNTGKPEFADGPRGGRLVARLGLDLVPEPHGDEAARATARPTPRRRAVEVYPHAASVALFRLGLTLKYKHKQGRAFAQLRSELLRLTGLLESLSRAHPPMLLARREIWEQLVTAVESATRKSELRVVEDQVDAVLCAYVAMLLAVEPDRLTTYGDAEHGAILTPTLPDDLEPAPRPSRSERTRDRTTEQYAARLPSLQAATSGYLELVTSILDEAGINYLSIEGRTKSLASFAEKAVSQLPAGSGTLRYTDPLEQMADQTGLRVVTYLASDVAAVAEALDDELRVLGDRDKGQETARQGRFGYASRHLDVTVDETRAADPTYAGLVGRQAEVQVRTVLQHAWAEFEHEIRYKGDVPAQRARELDRRFTLAAGLLELADREFSTIRDELRQELTPVAGAGDQMGDRDLAAYLAGRYPGAGWSRTEHYQWMCDLLAELDIATPAALGEALGALDSEAVTARMGYRYPAGAVRRLDDDLLATYGDRYVGLAGNAHRVGLLTDRSARIGEAPTTT